MKKILFLLLITTLTIETQRLFSQNQGSWNIPFQSGFNWEVTKLQFEDNNIQTDFLSISNLPENNYTVYVSDNTYPPVTQKSFTIDVSENLYTDDDTVNIYDSTQDWNNQQRTFKYGIYVHVGADFSISNSYLQFGPEAEIIVEQGAKLTIDHSTLTYIANCNCYWKGIQVWGNSTASQYPDAEGNYAQGFLDIRNNSVIENSISAVELWKLGDWSTTGGIVHARSTLFRNNTKAIKALYYRNFNPYSTNHEEVDYNATFKNCSFELSDNYSGTGKFYKHVDLAEVRGIDFEGCNFSLDQNAPNVSTWNAGIDGYNAGYRVNDYCNSDYLPCPDTFVVRSSFSGFYYAIRTANSTKPMSHIGVYDANFINNGYGIYLSAVYAPVIVNDSFEIGAVDDCFGYKVGVGIHLDNSKLFSIEQNYFEIYASSMPAQNIGIRVKNTNNAEDELYKNDFNTLDVSILAEGKNWSGNNRYGLAYYCNNNQNNEYDFYVKKIGRYDGIQKYQGSNSLVAGNTFSTVPNDIGNFDNESNYTIDYYYDQNSQYEYPAKRKNVNEHPELLTKVCPSHYGNGSDIRMSSIDYQQRETDYNNASAFYNSASASYDAASDLATRSYWGGKMSYYNTKMARAAYDIIRSDLADTIAHPDRFKTWMEKLNTYASAEAMVDFYLQQGDYTTALNKVDLLPYRFTFTAYDRVEYPLYKDFKHKQASWLSDGRTIFDLTTAEINSLIAIADSSKGTAGAQARGILLFAYDSLYSYTDFPRSPGGTVKSAKINSDSNTGNSSLVVTTKPNPANSMVTFQYVLPDNVQKAIIELYDNFGKKVNRITVDKAGVHSIDCSDFPSGIYFYRILAGNSSQTGKIIITH